MTTQKIAVAVVHGVGNQESNFADKIIETLCKHCTPVMGEDLIVRSVYWAPVLNDVEKKLIENTRKGGIQRQQTLREFLINLMGDAFAYQPTKHDRSAYDGIHATFAGTLRRLADEAGPTAPLCVISHSLGSVIASNFIYDLQAEQERPLISAQVRTQMNITPLELGKTLSLFYTLGSPLAMFSLRYNDFGKPIQVPSPQLATYYPGVQSEWINFYDPDDPIGAPIKTLNDAYGAIVSEDRAVNVGNLFASWNPLSHLAYWRDKDILKPIADSLCRVWNEVNRPGA